MVDAIDLTSQRFGRLVVMRRSPNMGANRRVAWECRCDCGATAIVIAYHLRRGLVRSCGCLQRESRGASQRTHGRTKSPEYKLWIGIIKRCLNPRCKSYKDYGGRGITICDRWRHSFVTFAADMGPRPEGASLERRDNNGHYEPSNVVWATKEEQANNTRSNRLVTFDGKTMSLARWARLTGIGSSTIKLRLDNGWTPEMALTVQPVLGRNQTWSA